MSIIDTNQTNICLGYRCIMSEKLEMHKMSTTISDIFSDKGIVK